MSIPLNPDRHSPLALIQSFNAAHFADGLVQAIAELPGGAIVLSGHVLVTTAFAGAKTLILGDAADTDRYTPVALDLSTTGLKAITGTGLELDQIQKLVATLDVKPTAGAARLVLQYAINGYGTSVQG
ncbi:MULTISPECIES: hypothetical protein [unclassified Pseudomonas]|uniref:hypothetical protein n=1 Tax=unclassified Pseudomonas TaxID=196821 RepID=UPI00131C0AA8|nr:MULTISPECIES: hypothetical protein [unclassified Pseudomonas]